MAEELEAEGIVVAKCPQSQTYFTEPIQDLQQAVIDRRFTHDGDPVLRWAGQNAVLVENARGGVMYDKANSNEKIDPIVALTMAYRVCMLAGAQASGSLVI